MEGEQQRAVRITYPDGLVKEYPIISSQKEGVFFQRQNHNIGFAQFHTPTDRWLVVGLEPPYEVEITDPSLALFTYDVDADRQILIQMPHRILERVCLTNRYANQLCSGPESETFLWREKIIHDYGEDIADLKPEGESFRQQNREISNTLAYWNNDPNDFNPVGTLSNALVIHRPDAVAFALKFQSAKDYLLDEGAVGSEIEIFLGKASLANAGRGNNEVDPNALIDTYYVLIREGVFTLTSLVKGAIRYGHFDVVVALHNRGVLDDNVLLEDALDAAADNYFAAVVDQRRQAEKPNLKKILQYLLDVVRTEQRAINPALVAGATNALHLR